MEAQVLKELVHVHISLEDEDAPPIRSRIPLHQPLERLQVNVPQVVHPPINFTHVNTEKSYFIAVH